VFYMTDSSRSPKNIEEEMKSSEMGSLHLIFIVGIGERKRNEKKKKIVATKK